jgi:predicted nucleic acid-binding Zn ribbon protein
MPARTLHLILNRKRACIVCRKPLPSTARADARLCSATCRKRDSRLGMAQRRTA